LSASIHWRPVSETKNTLDVAAPSAFRDAIRECFGELPVQLDEKAIPILRGMAAMCRSARGNPYSDLIDAIQHCGAIEVWATY